MEDKKSEYKCPTCGATLETCKHWGPTCKIYGQKVCATCCYHCGHHVTWSGIWHCSYMTEEEEKAERLRQRQARFDEENNRISAAYHKKRKEERRQWAIRQAKQRAKAEKAKQSKSK